MQQSAEWEARDESQDLERFVKLVRRLRTISRAEIDKTRFKKTSKKDDLKNSNGVLMSIVE